VEDAARLQNTSIDILDQPLAQLPELHILRQILLLAERWWWVALIGANDLNILDIAECKNQFRPETQQPVFTRDPRACGCACTGSS
jgi:hypothetical protein